MLFCCCQICGYILEKQKFCALTLFDLKTYRFSSIFNVRPWWARGSSKMARLHVKGQINLFVTCLQQMYILGSSFVMQSAIWICTSDQGSAKYLVLIMFTEWEFDMPGKLLPFKMGRDGHPCLEACSEGFTSSRCSSAAKYGNRPLTANLRWCPFSSVPHVSDRLELDNNNRASWILHPGPSESDVYSDVVQEAQWNDLLHTARLLICLDTPLHGNNARGAKYAVYYASVATHPVFENIKMAALRAMSEEKSCSPFPCFFIPWWKQHLMQKSGGTRIIFWRGCAAQGLKPLPSKDFFPSKNGWFDFFFFLNFYKSGPSSKAPMF